VFALAFHPDGQRILSGGIDGLVKVWDVLQSRPVVCRGHSESVTGAAFSRDGRQVATESDMWRVALIFGGATEQLRKKTKLDTRFWDADTGQQVPPPAAPGVDPAFGPFRRFEDLTDRSPDGRRIVQAAGCRTGDSPADPEVRVIDAASGRVVLRLVGHTDSVPCVAFSPDGRRIATTSSDRTVKLWDSETGQEVLTLRDHTASLSCVAFSPDGHRLVSGSIDHTARVWDATPLQSETPQTGEEP
jgi:WD40 repeat protein